MNEIRWLFKYGSQVYNTQTKQSDFDYLVVLTYWTEENEILLNQIKDFISNIEWIDIWKIELKIYNEVSFLSEFDRHEISVLECYYLDHKNILIPFNFPKLQIDKWKLRMSFCQKSSNSWVKCKKKFIIQEDYNPYIWKKSVWHSLRILMFWIQIAKFWKIVDYQEANKYHQDIMNMSSWEDIDKKYKSLYNSLSSEFRILCPKPTN